MNVKDHISSQLDSFSESELVEVANYIAYLKFRTRTRKGQIPTREKLAALYREAADEDARLAEVGMGDYVDSLATEDSA